MLGDKNVYATLPVKDMQEAKSFYEGVLGLSALDENPAGVLYQSGNTKVFVYASEFADTNKATAANWEVSDVHEVVDGLKNEGVDFERYTKMEGVTLDGDVHIMGAMEAAWFKDPFGNILCVSSGS